MRLSRFLRRGGACPARFAETLPKNMDPSTGRRMRRPYEARERGRRGRFYSVPFNSVCLTKIAFEYFQKQNN